MSNLVKRIKVDFDYLGWVDEHHKKPNKSGQYLCLVKWYNASKYQYSILEYDSNKECWVVTDSCEHIYWTNLLPNPFL